MRTCVRKACVCICIGLYVPMRTQFYVYTRTHTQAYAYTFMHTSLCVFDRFGYLTLLFVRYLLAKRIQVPYIALVEKREFLAPRHFVH